MICSFAKHTKHYLCVLVFMLKCQYYFDHWKTNTRSNLQSFSSIFYLFNLHPQRLIDFIHGCNPIPDICCFNLWLYIKLLWWVNTIYCFSIVLLIFKLCGRRSRVTENEMDLCTVLLVTSSIVWHASVCLTIVNVTIKGFLIMLRKKVVFTFYFIVR